MKQINTKAIRIQLDMTQQEFAHALGVGIATVARWEREESPTEPSKLAIAEINRVLKRHGGKK